MGRCIQISIISPAGTNQVYSIHDILFSLRENMRREMPITGIVQRSACNFVVELEEGCAEVIEKYKDFSIEGGGSIVVTPAYPDAVVGIILTEDRAKPSEHELQSSDALMVASKRDVEGVGMSQFEGDSEIALASFEKRRPYDRPENGQTRSQSIQRGGNQRYQSPRMRSRSPKTMFPRTATFGFDEMSRYRSSGGPCRSCGLARSEHETGKYCGEKGSKGEGKGKGKGKGAKGKPSWVFDCGDKDENGIAFCYDYHNEMGDACFHGKNCYYCHNCPRCRGLHPISKCSLLK